MADAVPEMKNLDEARGFVEAVRPSSASLTPRPNRRQGFGVHLDFTGGGNL